MAVKIQTMDVPEMFAHARELQAKSSALHMAWRQAIAEKRIADAERIRLEFREVCADFNRANGAAQEAAIVHRNKEREKPVVLKRFCGVA